MAEHQNPGHNFRIIPTQDHSTELGHMLPFKTYLKVLTGLLVLTVLTVWITRLDFGAWNIVVAMVVASLKASLVACFFMHLKFENKFTIGFALFPFILLAILMGGVFLDNPFRSNANGVSVIEQYSGGRMDPAQMHNPAP